MCSSRQYFTSAREEELSGNYSSALLFYLSSFCAGFNSLSSQYPFQPTAKIRKLQLILGLTDSQLLSYVHSYGPLSDLDCQMLLQFSIDGNVSGIHSVLCNHYT